MMELFKNISDAEWLNMLVNPRDGIPLLPPENIQERFCGRSGQLAMEQAMEFYKVIREASKNTGRQLGSMDAIMDFGCGWGRIFRCFLRDVSPGVLCGCDCMPEMVNYCKNTFPGFEFIQNDPFPPIDFHDGKFDLIYAYSVFSHLSEAAHMAWLREFYRIMRPGGLIVLTTRPREFISYWPKLPYIHRVDDKKALSEYDAGKLVHIPVSGGDNLSDSFYGETAIPEAYIRSEWSKWFKVERILDNVIHVDQKIIVARKV